MMAGIRSSQTGFSQIAFANTTVFYLLTWATQSHLIQRGSNCPLTEDFHAYIQSLTLSLRTLSYTVQCTRRCPFPEFCFCQPHPMSKAWVEFCHYQEPRGGEAWFPATLPVCSILPSHLLPYLLTFPSVTEGQRDTECQRSQKRVGAG